MRELRYAYTSFPQSLGGLLPGVSMLWHTQPAPPAGRAVPRSRDSLPVKECRRWQLKVGPVCTRELNTGEVRGA